MAETRWVRFGLGRALNAGRGSSLIGSIPRCEGDRLMSILDIGSNVNSKRNGSFIQLYGSDWRLDSSSATICPRRLDGLPIARSVGSEINGLRIGTLSAIAIAAVILNHTARPVLGGLSGSPGRVLPAKKLSSDEKPDEKPDEKIADWEFLPTGFGSLRDG